MFHPIYHAFLEDDGRRVEVICRGDDYIQLAYHQLSPTRLTPWDIDCLASTSKFLYSRILDETPHAYRLRFEHLHDQDHELRLTVASVQVYLTDDRWTTLFEGRHFQKASRFKRAVGRKVALTKALRFDQKTGGAEREFRRAVWSAYWHSQDLDWRKMTGLKGD